MASSVDMELGDMMYELCLMALFFVEGANLLVPFRENFQGHIYKSVCVKSFHCGNILIIAGSVLTCLLFKSRKVG